ncbi:MAG: DNA mismatch repair endonuclease MutL [Oscillospiraceae bacterium]
MGKINVLPENLAQLIAAGEVVDRPASVIKELVENAIDAGANKIEVHIKDGGVSYMKVKDNGQGFLYDDMKVAFTRYATSKIKTSDDLNKIVTLGFRGEALPSIASVSKITLISKNKGENIGKQYVIHGGKDIIFEDFGSELGTTFIIEDLFFNTPARLKFLKKSTTEGNLIASIIDKIALSHPDISFVFIKDNKECLRTPGDGKLLSAIIDVFNKNASKELINIGGETGYVKVNGYISKAIHTRANRSMQYFYVNGRYVKSQIFSVALEQAYRNLIMSKKHPSCVINLDMPPASFDINVHPSKIEVRFSDEKLVFDAIYTLVKATLIANAKNIEKQIFLDIKTDNIYSHENVNAKDISVSYVGSEENQYNILRNNNNSVTDIYKKQTDSFYNNLKQTNKNNKNIYIEYDESIFSQDDSDNKKTLENFFDNQNLHIDKPENDHDKDNINSFNVSLPNDIEKTLILNNNSFEEESFIKSSLEDEIKIIGEIFDTYVIYQNKKDIYFLDKHAAHERIIYENVKKSLVKPSSQPMMETLIIELSKNEYNCVLGKLDLLKEAGFIIKDFGEGSIIIDAIPVYLNGYDIKEIFMDISNNLLKNNNDISFEKLDWLAESIACRSAIKANDKNKNMELKKLVLDIYNYDIVKFCPHGRPIAVKLSKNDIEKIFGR